VSDGVTYTVAVVALVCVAVGTGDDVGMRVNVEVGHEVNVYVGGMGVFVNVEVGKVGMIVTPGVLVGTFGTHNLCPV
jgi:hypothetical protein